MGIPMQQQTTAYTDDFVPLLSVGTRKELTSDQVFDIYDRIRRLLQHFGTNDPDVWLSSTRIALGGGVNVERSTIGRILGLLNSEIAVYKGEDLVHLLNTRLTEVEERASVI